MDWERELSDLRNQNEMLVRMIGELMEEMAALRAAKDLPARLPSDPPAPHCEG